ncbi:MAG TPA: T9SS type A sorting domain-containing protein, partial [Rubricoccaceae bacterium]|nr:T9SS type A sorting domain-containing protein [Rubricoccaceae bacterium]
DRIEVGREIGGLGYAAMDVAAVVVYDRALSASERAEVEAYLQEKYLGGALSRNRPEHSGRVVYEVEYPEGWSLVGLLDEAADLQPGGGSDVGCGGDAVGVVAADVEEVRAYVAGARRAVREDYAAASPTRLVPGQGYWMKRPRAATTRFCGDPRAPVERRLSVGWNLISGPACTAPAAEVLGQSGVVPGTLYGFDGGYYPVGDPADEHADVLQPGRAYWVKAAEEVVLSLGCREASQTPTRHAGGAQGAGRLRAPAVSGDPGTPTLDPARLGRLTVRDAGGNEQRLYFAAGDAKAEAARHAEQFALPPPPPAGAFDARFEGDLRLAPDAETVVWVQAAAFPLRVEVSGLADGGAAYELEVLPESGPPVTYPFVPAAGDRGHARGHVLASVVETAGPGGAGAVALRLRRHAEAVPSAFALLGTYPNPFTAEASLAFDLPEDAEVQLEVYDVLGRRVLRVSEPAVSAGADRRLRLSATHLAAGTYFFRLAARMSSETAVETGRFTVVR